LIEVEVKELIDMFSERMIVAEEDERKASSGYCNECMNERMGLRAVDLYCEEKLLKVWTEG